MCRNTGAREQLKCHGEFHCRTKIFMPILMVASLIFFFSLVLEQQKMWVIIQRKSGMMYVLSSLVKCPLLICVNPSVRSVKRAVNRTLTHYSLIGVSNVVISHLAEMDQNLNLFGALFLKNLTYDIIIYNISLCFYLFFGLHLILQKSLPLLLTR